MAADRQVPADPERPAPGSNLGPGETSQSYRPGIAAGLLANAMQDRSWPLVAAHIGEMRRRRVPDLEALYEQEAGFYPEAPTLDQLDRQYPRLTGVEPPEKGSTPG
jgi:hypothetical protein